MHGSETSAPFRILQRAGKPTDRQQADRAGHREVSRPIFRGVRT